MCKPRALNFLIEEYIITNIYKYINSSYSSSYELLTSHLICRLPSKICGWSDRKSFDLRFKIPTKRALEKNLWIEYNQSWLNTLIFDIDYKTTLDEAINKCLELGIEPTWACTTTNGAHLAFALENIIKYEWEKPINYARDIKIALTSALQADVNGSHRLKGIWRNPLQAKEFYFSNLLYSLNDFKHIIIQNFEKDKSSNEIFNKKIKTRKIDNKGYCEGTRNDTLWRMAMIACKNTNYEEIYHYVYKIHMQKSNKTVKSLSTTELKKIARSVLKYNLEGKNFVGHGTSGVWNWNYKKKYNTKEEIEELKMTRRERALANAAKREKEARKKVLDCINSLKADEYKKKNGSWHISKIAKDTNLHRETVSKHLKAYEK